MPAHVKQSKLIKDALPNEVIELKSVFLTETLLSLPPMADTITYHNCPVCNSEKIHKVLQAKDYTVSHESFEIWQCDNCTLRFTQNVPAENVIGKYYQSTAYVSHSDTKKGLINRLYHLVRSYTLQSKLKLVQKVSGKNKGTLLDIGAGTGAFVNTMQTAGWDVSGLEPDETARKNAAANYNINLQQLDALFTLPENKFDVITMWHVLEHVHQLQQYLSRFQQLLREDGVVIIAVPNYTSYDATIYNEYWAAYDVPRHLYHFSPLSMQRLFEQHGFVVIEHQPMWFDSFYVSMLSEQYKTGKSNLTKAIANGLASNRKAFGDATKCSSVIYIIRRKK